MTVAENLASWLDEIGADGLMYPTEIGFIWKKENISRGPSIDLCLVPAYRHADGTYHTDPEPCFNCEKGHRPECTTPDVPCYWYQSWLSHKEAK